MTVPTTMTTDLDRLPDVSRCEIEDHFLIQRVEATEARRTPTAKSSCVPAMLVSVSLAPLAAANHRLWIDGKLVRERAIPAFRSNVVDLGAHPTIWSAGPYRYVHFNVRRSALDDVTSDNAYARVGPLRTAIFEEDLVLAQMARSAVTIVGRGDASALALDQFELVLAAHMVQRYGTARPATGRRAPGLPAWKQQRAEELLRENLDGSVRLADLARECELSVSHFARGFKASFGVSPHHWLIERRIERAQELLRHSDLPLVDIAILSGFKDQPAFTRTFRRRVGATPGQWRREHALR